MAMKSSRFTKPPASNAHKARHLDVSFEDRAANIWCENATLSAQAAWNRGRYQHRGDQEGYLGRSG